MQVGRAVGYGLLALVDAFVPATVAAVLTWGALLGRASIAASTGLLAGAAAGAVVFVLTLAGSAISHYRGGRPFAFTRLATAVFKWWPPWSPFGGRRRER